jgi:NAD-dependent DNA ligase
VDDLDSNWGVIEPDDRLKGKAIVITGALTNTREYYKTLIEVMGGVFGSAITGKTAYLVVGDTTFQGDANHKSTKAKKAAALGIPVISESGLISIINKGA